MTNDDLTGKSPGLVTVPEEAVQKAINRRAWQLAQMQFEHIRDNLLEAITRGEIMIAQIDTWVPSRKG